MGVSKAAKAQREWCKTKSQDLKEFSKVIHKQAHPPIVISETKLDTKVWLCGASPATLNSTQAKVKSILDEDALPE